MLSKTRARLLAIAVALSISAVVLAAPAIAITDGSPDGDGHPHVGLMVAKNAAGAPLWRCSGTLMNSRIFLTAGHCTEAPAASVEVWFDAGPIPLGEGYPNTSGSNPCRGVKGYPCTGDSSGTPFTHPDYDANLFYVRDIGVVRLNKPIQRSVYGALPALNSLDGLKTGKSTTFTAVGYGLQASYPDPASFLDQAVRVRMVANPNLLQINTALTGDYSMLLSNNTNTGGTCFGDSGGPNFLGDSNVVAGITSFGMNSTCAGTGGTFRTDRSWSLDWLETFGLTP